MTDRRVWLWSPRQMLSVSPPTIGFLPSAVVYNTQERRAETPRLQRCRKLSQALPHPVRVLLGACEAGKASCFHWLNGRGREAAHASRASGAEGQ